MTAAQAAQLALSALILIVNAAQLRAMTRRRPAPPPPAWPIPPYRGPGQATGSGSVPPRR